MVIKSMDMMREERERMRGGDGVVRLCHFAQPGGGLPEKARLMCEIELPAGASIGEHAHVGETELYYILSGSGVVADDGMDKAVSAGDAVFTGGGASHNIRNTGADALKMIAVIVLD